MESSCTAQPYTLTTPFDRSPRLISPFVLKLEIPDEIHPSLGSLRCSSVAHHLLSCRLWYGGCLLNEVCLLVRLIMSNWIWRTDGERC
ncbi:hypothetical protein V6N13_033569 [Hibiscus sabdariffa]